MNRRDAEEKFKEADQLYRRGEFRKSLDLLNELNREYPEHKHIMFPRARCLNKLGETDLALGLCEQLIRNFKHDKAVALRERILMHRDSGKWPAFTAAPDDDLPFEPLGIEIENIDSGAFAKFKPVSREATPGWLVPLIVVVVVLAALGATYFFLFWE